MSTLVPAVARALRILDVFKRNERTEYGVSEISRALSLNKSTVHGILNTLNHWQFLERNPVNQKYRLGVGLIELGGLTLERLDARAIVRPLLTNLMQETGETVFLSVFEKDHITVVETEEPVGDIKITASIGQRIPFSAGSLGQVFLAWMNEAQVDRLLVNPGLRAFTATSITDAKLYKESLEKVRVNGYAVDDTEDYLEGVWAVSAPIFDIKRLRGALTVVGFSSRMCESDKANTVRLVHGASREVSRKLGKTI